MRRPLRLLTSTLTLALAGLAAPASHAAEQGASAPAIQPIAPLSPDARLEDERNTIAISRHAASSAVFVTQQQLVVDYFAGRTMEVPSGSGSGFVWDEKGHVVTNFHVVQGAKSLTVTFQNQQVYPARLVGVEPRKDIAVLKIEAPPEVLVPVRKPDRKLELEVGQKVVAIGNPFGLDHTVTTGIVSALGRQVEGPVGVTLRDLIQTDAAINPGNSGGPLLDSAGRLIGMNTAIYSRSGTWAGIGFAVPVDTILRIVPQLIRDGRVRQVGLGVQIDPTRRIERRLGLRGMAIFEVVPTSPAATAGLEGLKRTRRGVALGDVIIAVDGKRVDDYDDYYNAFDGREPGDKVEVRIQRGEQVFTRQLPLVMLE